MIFTSRTGNKKENIVNYKEEELKSCENISISRKNMSFLKKKK